MDAVSKKPDDLKDDVKKVSDNVAKLLFYLLDKKPKVILAKVSGTPLTA